MWRYDIITLMSVDKLFSLVVRLYVLFVLVKVFISISSPVFASDSWWNDNWVYRKKITFNNSAQSEGLTNFPVAVILDSSNFDFSRTKSTGEDVRFIDSDGTSSLSYEIEKWDVANRSGVIWVNVPLINASSNTDYIYMYYGNSGIGDGQSENNTWNSDFLSVWHLSEDPSGVAPQVQDSTDSLVHLTSRGGMTQSDLVAGRIGDALDFDGATCTASGCLYTSAGDITGDDRLYVLDSTKNSLFKFGATQDFTSSAWIKTDDPVAYWKQYMGNESADTRHGFGMLIQKDTRLPYLTTDSGTCCTATYGTTAVNDNQWHHIVTMREGDRAYVYVDGVLEGLRTSGATASFASAATFTIGKDPNNYLSYHGLIDEARVATKAFSANWVRAEYKVGTNTFNTYSSEEMNGVNKSLSLGSTLQNGRDGKRRLTGNFTSESNSYMANIEYSINGGNFLGANITDGSFNSANEDFYIDFLTTDNNWRGVGYSVRAKAVHSGVSVIDNVFQFEPFTLNIPKDKTVLTTQTPVFEFSVIKQQNVLKDNLSKYQVQVTKEGANLLSSWRVLIDDIPVSGNMINGDTRTFETNKFKAVYKDDSSVVSVNSKVSMNSGEYLWRVAAIDKSGRQQVTDPRHITIMNTGKNLKNDPTFPLALLHMSNLTSLNMTTINTASVKSDYFISTLSPRFFGIAFANSKVVLILNEVGCDAVKKVTCAKRYETVTRPNSRFDLQIPKGELDANRSYVVNISTSLDGRFAQLPAFLINSQKKNSLPIKSPLLDNF